MSRGDGEMDEPAEIEEVDEEPQQVPESPLQEARAVLELAAEAPANLASLPISRR